MILVREAGWRLASGFVSCSTLPELPSTTISAYGAARDGWLVTAKMTATSPHRPQRSPPGAPVPIPSMYIPPSFPWAPRGDASTPLYPPRSEHWRSQKGRFSESFPAFLALSRPFSAIGWLWFQPARVEAKGPRLQKRKAARALLHCKIYLDFFVHCNISRYALSIWPVGARR